MLADKIPAIVKQIEKYFEETVGYNRVLIDILEGDLLKYVLQVMKKELSPKAYERARGRVPAINVLSRVVDKLSQLYDEPVVREASGNDIDTELISFYEGKYDIDNNLGFGNRLYNTNKRFALEPYIRDGQPSIRVLAANEFLVYSDDPFDKSKMNVFIKFGNINMNEILGVKERIETSTFYLYSNDEILYINGKGEILPMKENPNNENPYGVIPFTYVKNTEIDLIPLKDSDTLTMSILIPLIFGDLNYATQYLSHSVFYGIDVNVSDMEMNPDAFWVVNSTEGENKRPQIGTIKPEVDIDKVLASIREQLYMWLDSKGIKAGSSGVPNVTASGIAKIIDEADATSARRSQIKKFRSAELDLWDKTKTIHEVWVRSNQLTDEKRLFSKEFNININYSDLRPLIDPMSELQEIKLRLEMNLTSQKRAVQDANPELDDEGIEALILEIEEEKKLKADVISKALSIEPVEEEDGEQSI